MSSFFPAHRYGAILTAQAVGFRVFAPSAVGAWVVIYDEANGPAGRDEFRSVTLVEASGRHNSSANSRDGFTRSDSPEWDMMSCRKSLILGR